MKKTMLLLLGLLACLTGVNLQPIACLEDHQCQRNYYCDSYFCLKCISCEDNKRFPPFHAAAGSCTKSITNCGACVKPGLVQNNNGECVPGQSQTSNNDNSLSWVVTSVTVIIAVLIFIAIIVLMYLKVIPRPAFSRNVTNSNCNDSKSQQQLLHQQGSPPPPASSPSLSNHTVQPSAPVDNVIDDCYTSNYNDPVSRQQPPLQPESPPPYSFSSDHIKKTTVEPFYPPLLSTSRHHDKGQRATVFNHPRVRLSESSSFGELNLPDNQPGGVSPPVVHDENTAESMWTPNNDTTIIPTETTLAAPNGMPTQPMAPIPDVARHTVFQQLTINTSANAQQESETRNGPQPGSDSADTGPSPGPGPSSGPSPSPGPGTVPASHGVTNLTININNLLDSRNLVLH